MAEDAAVVQPQNSICPSTAGNVASTFRHCQLTLPPPSGDFVEAQGAWCSRSEELEDWVDRCLLNRSDVYGQYLSLCARKGGSKSFTAPADEGRRFPGVLTAARIKRHFCGFDRGHLIGIHAISQQNTSRWFALDIDQHSENGGTSKLTNIHAARHWCMVLTNLGFHPLVMDSNGNGGLHVWVILQEPVPSWVVYHFAQWLVKDHRKLGLTDVPETFPKQISLSESCKYGNWLRLPGLHHSRDHWTAVWAQDQWLTCESAINCLVQTTGDGVSILREWLISHPMLPETQTRTVSPVRPSIVRHSSSRLVPLTGHTMTQSVMASRLSTKTRRFLLGYFQNESQWNHRLFAAACDMAGNGFSFEVALVQLLQGAGPYDDHERELATRTIRSAFSKDRRAAIGFSPATTTVQIFKVGEITVVRTPDGVTDNTSGTGG